MKILKWPRYFEKGPKAYQILFWYRILFNFCIAGQVFFNKIFLLSLFNNGQCYPIELFQWLNISFINSQSYSLLVDLLVLSFIFAGLGILGRISILTSLCLFILVIGQSIGCARGQVAFYTSWQHCIVVFNLIILLVSPSTHSVISLKKKTSMIREIEFWPVELLKFNLVYAYFSGGIVKIKNGLEWMNGYTLQGHIFYSHLESDLPVAFNLAQNLTLMKVVSIGTVVIELLFPIVLFTKRPVGWTFAVVAFMMQVVFWYYIDLQWMRYFGWSYWIYFLEIMFFCSWRKRDSISMTVTI